MRVFTKCSVVACAVFRRIASPLRQFCDRVPQQVAPADQHAGAIRADDAQRIGLAPGRGARHAGVSELDGHLLAGRAPQAGNLDAGRRNGSVRCQRCRRLRSTLRLILSRLRFADTALRRVARTAGPRPPRGIG